MKANIQKLVTVLILTGSVMTANAGVCNIAPGNIVCGQGIVDSLSGNGMVTTNGTTVVGVSLVNGLLHAEGANFFSLEVNGGAKLTRCAINSTARIKGSLTTFSTKFKKGLEIYSSKTRLNNSKVNGDLHIGHTDSRKQSIYLNNLSEISGDIIFDDGDGEVILRGQSKIGGKVIGGRTVPK